MKIELEQFEMTQFLMRFVEREQEISSLRAKISQLENENNQTVPHSNCVVGGDFVVQKDLRDLAAELIKQFPPGLSNKISLIKIIRNNLRDDNGHNFTLKAAKDFVENYLPITREKNGS